MLFITEENRGGKAGIQSPWDLGSRWLEPQKRGWMMSLLIATLLLLLLGAHVLHHLLDLQWLSEPENLKRTFGSTEPEDLKRTFGSKEFLEKAAKHNVSCRIHRGISAPLASLLCGIETRGYLRGNTIFQDDRSLCLIGDGKCDAVLYVPTADEVTKAGEPPKIDDESYIRLVLVSEKFIPPSWWMDAYNDSSLLLFPRYSPIPLLGFSEPVRGAKLGSMTHCLTSKLSEPDYNSGRGCRATKEPVVLQFKEQWDMEYGRFGGSFSRLGIWSKNSSSASVFQSARATLNFFLAGNPKKSCVNIRSSRFCNGALSAAALLEGINILIHLSPRNMPQKVFGSKITQGYLLASVGRHLLHRSKESPFTPVTPWGVKLVDFVALQSLFLRIYTSSLGRKYTLQLNTYIPLAFAPNLSIPSDLQWRSFASQIEPVYATLRNWMFTEAEITMDYGSYIPLVSIPAAREAIFRDGGRRIFIDAGASSFFTSSKYLADSYAVYLPFTDIIMIEPTPIVHTTIPSTYSSAYNITVLPVYAEVGTGSDRDIIELVPSLVKQNDFVVLKFDVDIDIEMRGRTMEWGFLYGLMKNPHVLRLVDEIYVEVHFHFPYLRWKHYHSNWEALDLLRYLRSQGVVIHSWP